MDRRSKKILYLLIASFSFGALIASIAASLLSKGSGNNLKSRFQNLFSGINIRLRSNQKQKEAEKIAAQKNWFEKLIA